MAEKKPSKRVTGRPVRRGTQTAVPTRVPSRPPAAQAKKPISPEKPAKSESVSLSVVGTDGKSKGTVSVSKKLFGSPAPQGLLEQSVRVHLANRRQGTASTKTRGEVEGSTRKIYRQKGTGRARHGAIRAPIFVGGGIVFGPKPRDYGLRFPVNMKRRALSGALSVKVEQGDMVIIDGLENLEPKTRIMAQTLAGLTAGKSTLLVVSGAAQGVVRAARNLAVVDVIPARNINAYEILVHDKVIVMKSALPEIDETFGKS